MKTVVSHEDFAYGLTQEMMTQGRPSWRARSYDIGVFIYVRGGSMKTPPTQRIIVVLSNYVNHYSAVVLAYHVMSKSVLYISQHIVSVSAGQTPCARNCPWLISHHVL